MLRLRNRLLPLLRAASPLPSPIHTRACRLLSTSTATVSAPFSLEDYLVAACGLAPAKAREVSKKVSPEISSSGSGRSLDELSCPRLYSASNPDAILALLAGVGLSLDDVAAVVYADPLLLRASVSTIAPRLLALHHCVGLSTPQIVRFLLVASRSLRRGDVVSRLEFFIDFYGSFEKALVAAKRNGSLLSVSLERLIQPNLALFHQWGVPDIVQLCSNFPRVLTFNQERLKESLLRAEQLGVPATSGLFGQAVFVSSYMSQEKLAAKLEFFKRTLGSSQAEVSIAVSKMPGLLGMSDENLLRKIEFLVNEGMMEPRYIVKCPIVLSLSLEKRLMPRHYVMKILQEKGLLNSNTSFSTFAKLGEKTFKLKFIDYHKDCIPGLAHAYATARVVLYRLREATRQSGSESIGCAAAGGGRSSDVSRRRGGGCPVEGAGADDGDQATAGAVQHGQQRAVHAAVAVLLRPRVGAGAAPLVVAGAAGGGRQRGHVRGGHVLQQLPAQRRRLRRPRLPPPLLLPAAQGEPAPRPHRRHAAEIRSPRLVQGGAREPGVAAGVVHLAARRPHPPARQHDQPHLHRRPPGAAVWILEGGAGVPRLRLRRERALRPLHQEGRLRGRLRRALRPPWSDAVGAHHQLVHLHEQICSHVEPDHHRGHQPGARDTPARRQLRAHRRVRYRLPPRLRAADPAPVRVAGAALRCQDQVQVQGISDHPPACCPDLAGCRVGCWIDHGVQRRQRQRSLQLVPLPHLRADVKLEV